VARGSGPRTTNCCGPRRPPRLVSSSTTYVFATADGARKDKIVLISWCPEAAEIEQRIAHSTSRNILRNLLDGVQVYAQTTDPSDLRYEELVSRTS
jgi:cofilin